MHSTQVKKKKRVQLGMDPGTAANVLRGDLLYHFARLAGHTHCYRCNEELTRRDFTIDHKEPWLDSSDPVGRFFSLDNIGFSHSVCNSSDARRPHKLTDAEIAALPASKRRRILYDRARGGGHLRKRKT